jgi:hypothetical protein
MALNLPTYRRGRAPQAGRDAANRSTRSNPARNLFALITVNAISSFSTE